MNARKKILFIAEGITAAHFTRCAVIAEGLDQNKWDIYFYTPERYHKLLTKVKKINNLETLPSATFLDAISKGKVAYTQEIITKYVQDELKIFDEIKPDIVIGDARFSLNISTKLRKIPFATIYNAYWSHYSPYRPSAPEIVGFTKYFPAFLNNLIFNLTKYFFYYLNARELNKVRKHFGLKHLSHDLRDFYFAGDMVLYPDTPELVPLKKVPLNHHFIGICNWIMPSPKPIWWEEAKYSKKPLVLVAMGSSGPLHSIEAILQGLENLEVEVILVTSGRDIPHNNKVKFVCNLISYEEVLPHISLVISHGGSSSIYPALAMGVPVLAIPTNLDQHYSTKILEYTHTGLVLRSESVTSSRIKDKVSQILSSPDFQINAKSYSTAIAQYNPAKIVDKTLDNWFEISQS